MNITNIQSIIAPILAPIAPAILFGHNLHVGMLADGVNPTLASVGAVLGTGGVELSGALACSMAVLAYHKRDVPVMRVSIAAACVYAALVVAGIMQAKNTATFSGAVGISLVSYMMQGVWQSYNNKLRMDKEEVSMKVSLINAQKNLVNAEVRKSRIVDPVHVNNTSTKSGQFPKLTDEKIAEIREYWKNNPRAKLREVGSACGVSVGAANKYKPEDLR